MSKKVAILGSGAWGVTLAKVLAEAGNEVIIWGIEEQVINEINSSHTQSLRLPGVILPATISATTNIDDILDAYVILVAIAAQHARGALEKLVPHFEGRWGVLRDNWPPFVSVMKGMEQSTGMMMGDMIADVLNTSTDKVACLAGPNLAKEIAKQMPAAASIASTNSATAETVAELFANSTYFSTEISTDMKGVELVSCLKNVYALAAGYYSGQGYGSSTIATVITGALIEARALIEASGGDADTLLSYAGIGDMIATCCSPLSRNHSFGYKIGQGISFEQALATSDGVSEGVPTVSVILALADKLGIDMPIAKKVQQIVSK